jgi:hypothetical protein
VAHHQQPAAVVTLDTDGRISRLAASDAQDIAIGYTNVDNITGFADGIHPSLNANFGYDAADRLTWVSRP